MNTFDKIHEWHVTERRRSLKAEFELGDMIIDAAIMNELSQRSVITRIIKNEGDLAYSITTYTDAAKLAHVYTKTNRKILIDNCISIEKAMYLSTEKMKDQREEILQGIKRGDYKWRKFYNKKRAEDNAPKNSDSHPTEEEAAFRVYRPLDEDKAESLFLAMFNDIKIHRTDMTFDEMDRVYNEVKGRFVR